jgi:fructokinase
VKRIGIDLGGSKIHGIVLGEDGTVLETHRVATPSGSYRATLDALLSVIEILQRSQVVARDGGPPAGRLSIGIGTPGVWQPAPGCMKNCNSTWLNGQPLLTDLIAHLGDRVRLANDADCFALSEALAGAGAGYASVFGVILGTGVGGGFVVDEQLLTGPNGLTGEWGHTPLPYAGNDDAARSNVDVDARNAILDGLESRLKPRQCYCGRLGCIETYLSGPGLQRTFHELWGEARDGEAITAGVDERAELTLSLYCRMLARSLAQIINIVDPGTIVLGGGLSNAGRIYAPLNRALARYVFSGECVTVVKPPRWGAESGVLGAARLWPDSG